jgi:protein arginine N-methyltransferase 2
MHRPNVRVEPGRWQEAVARLAAAGKRFDAIFFDTYAEHYRDMQVHFFGWFCVSPGWLDRLT